MKAVKVKILGKEHYLAMNGEAMFTIQDEFGGAAALLEKIAPDTRESFIALCRAAAILAEQGELARRYLGYEPGEILKAEKLIRLIQPPEILSLKQDIPRALTLGYGSEIDKKSKKEIDLVLLELNQKKTR